MELLSHGGLNGKQDQTPLINAGQILKTLKEMGLRTSLERIAEKILIRPAIYRWLLTHPSDGEMTNHHLV